MARFSWRKWFGFESNLGQRDELRRRFRPSLEQLEDRITPSPVLCTDLPAYRQGALVQIAGTGFDANEQVALQVVPSDGSAATNSWTVVAADGSLNTSWNVASVNSAGDGLTITAAGADGDSAQAELPLQPDSNAGHPDDRPVELLARSHRLDQRQRLCAGRNRDA